MRILFVGGQADGVWMDVGNPAPQVMDVPRKMTEGERRETVSGLADEFGPQHGLASKPQAGIRRTVRDVAMAPSGDVERYTLRRMAGVDFYAYHGMSETHVMQLLVDSHPPMRLKGEYR